MKKQTKKKVNNGDKKCYALEDCYWRISDTNICTSPNECLSNLKPKKMKTTKAELLQKIIAKQKELINLLEQISLRRYQREIWDKRLQYYNELTALNAQLAEQQSTPVKQAFDKPGFFESQMEDGTLRKELIKIVKWMCDENISRFCDPDKIVNEYLNSKE